MSKQTLASGEPTPALTIGNHITPIENEKITLWVLSRDLEDLAKSDAFGNFDITSIRLGGTKPIINIEERFDIPTPNKLHIPIRKIEHSNWRIKDNKSITGDRIDLKDIYSAIEREEFSTSFILKLLAEDKEGNQYYFVNHKLQVKGSVYEHTRKKTGTHATCLKLDKVTNNKNKEKILTLEKFKEIKNRYFSGKTWEVSSKEGNERDTDNKPVCIVTGCEKNETITSAFRCVKIYV